MSLTIRKFRFKNVQIHGVFFESNWIIPNLFHSWCLRPLKYTEPIKASQNGVILNLLYGYHGRKKQNHQYPYRNKVKIHITRFAIFQEVMDVALECCCRREWQNVVSVTFRWLLMTNCLPWGTLIIAVPSKSLMPHGTSDSLPLVCSMSDDLPCVFIY